MAGADDNIFIFSIPSRFRYADIISRDGVIKCLETSRAVRVQWSGDHVASKSRCMWPLDLHCKDENNKEKITLC